MDDVLAAVDEQSILEFLCAAIRVPGITGAEDDISRFLVERLRAGGWSDVESIGTGNVVGRIPGAGGPPLVFLAYIDSPPPGEMVEPYEAQILPGERFGRVHPVVRGRGACTKGILASMVEAGEALSRRRVRLPGDLVVIGTSRDTEGLRAVVEHSQLPRGTAIVGEPTENAIGIAARGITWIDVEIRGEASHAGTPQRAINPIQKLPRVLAALEAITLPERDGLPRATLTPTGVAHTGSPPRTPYSVTVRFDRRTLPGEKPEDVVADIERALVQACGTDPTLNVSVSTPDFMAPYLADAGSSIVRDLADAIHRVTGRDASLMPLPFATNAGYLAARGWDAVAFGPTRIADRGDDEHAEIARVVEAAQILMLLAADHSPDDGKVV